MKTKMRIWPATLSMLIMVGLCSAVLDPVSAQTNGDVKSSEWEPRVIHVDRTEPVTYKTVVLGNPADLTFALSNGDSVILQPIGNDTYQASLTMAQVLHNHQADDQHNFVGFLEVPGPCPPLQNGCRNEFINVRTDAMPDVPIFDLAPDAQASKHVINLRYDTLLASATPVEPLLRFYELLPDDFDFVAVLEQVSYPRNRFYRPMRNDTLGIGQTVFDSASQLGLPPRLRGVIHYPIHELFDLAATASVHEIGHRWINFLDHPSLQQSGPHWPLSDLAYSVMGYSTAGGQGLQFPWELTEQPSGDYLVNFIEPAREFHDFDLYLMGLLSPEETGQHFVFQDQNQQPGNGQLLLGPVDLITIDDVIAIEGPRIPAATEAQKDFRIATIVLSCGGLLSDNEMAFFDYMAARGEATTELPFTSGFSGGTTKPFYLATGGRGTLSSTITSDLDSDGVPDNADNCPTFANADQADADQDGIGNMCDVFEAIAMIPDINQNGFPEVAVVASGGFANCSAQESTRRSGYVIRDGLTDAEILRSCASGPHVDIVVLPDPDLADESDGPAIAFLAVDDPQNPNLPVGFLRVQIKDVIAHQDPPRNIWYEATYSPVAIKLVPDYSGNGAPELAILGSEAGTDAVSVRILDSITGANPDNILLGVQSIARDVLVLTDTSGNGVPEMGIVGVLKANDHVRMQVWDPLPLVNGAEFQSNVWFGKVYQPISTITMPDINSNGSDEIVAVGVSALTDNIRVQVRDSDTTATLYNIWLGAVNEAVDIALINDINSDGVSDLAVLLKRPDGTGRVRVQSGANGAFIRNLFYTVVDDPVGLAVLPDYDSSGFEELAVLGTSGGVRHVQILDTFSGSQVNRIDFP
jgi:hypothetical protein